MTVGSLTLKVAKIRSAELANIGPMVHEKSEPPSAAGLEKSKSSRGSTSA